MASKVLHFKKVLGFTGRCNDMLYSAPYYSSVRHRVLIFFGGDVQDLHQSMEMHNESKKYLEWSLENTAQILSERFPQCHVVVVLPVRMEVKSYAVFSCYENFVLGNKYGVPEFRSTHNALEHLKQLLQSISSSLPSLSKEKDQLSLDNGELMLMGFSKGCVVLNQLLHEFHYLQTNQKDNESSSEFISHIRDMYWLDGGHGGNKDTWITDRGILETLVKLGIRVHIHVTPYQVCDDRRPWIRMEENTFSETLRELQAPLDRNVHFKDKPRSLAIHFNVLTIIQDKKQ